MSAVQDLLIGRVWGKLIASISEMVVSSILEIKIAIGSENYKYQQFGKVTHGNIVANIL